MAPRPVVTVFLVHGGRVLLLRRSGRVRTFPGRWAGVSGSIPPGVSPLQQALQEVQEETGLGPQDLQVEGSAPPLHIADEEGREWLVHPFRVRVRDPGRVRLDWEHAEARWVEPSVIRQVPTVPGLWEAWERVSPEGPGPSGRGEGDPADAGRR